MEIRIDLKAGAAYITLRPGKVRDTKELGGGYFLDYGEGDEVLGIEVLHLERKGATVAVNVPNEVWECAK